MATTQIEKIKAIGEKLSIVRARIQEREETFENENAKDKAEREELQTSLFNELKASGVTSIKSDSGYTFLIASKKAFSITDQEKATKWAIKNKAMRADLKMIETLLKASKTIPEGFEVVEKEYISIRKPKEEAK